MADFNTFVQLELPKRPFTEVDGAQGQIPVRSGLGPRQLDWAWIADLLPAPSVVGSDYTFSTSSTWTVTHNKNSRKFVASCFDDQGNQFFAKINIIDANSFQIKLTEAAAGSVNVVFM